MTNNTSDINTEIIVNGQKLETVTSFKYLRSVVSDGSSKSGILSRIAQTTAALTRLIPVWNDRSISFSFKIRLMRSLVTSIFLYACESWSLTAEVQRRIRAMEMRCYRKGHLDTTDDFKTSFSVFHCHLGLGELQTCPFPDVCLVFSPLYVSQ